MAQSLPLHANLEWLKKRCKERLARLRVQDPQAKLSAAQREVAREYGFASWRQLKSHVDRLRQQLARLAPPPNTASEAIAPDDAELAQLLAAAQAGEMATVSRLLAGRPLLTRAHGPEGQTALHVAAQCNDARLALTLLACGADPNATFGESGHTPLSWAITCNALDCAAALVRLGSKPDLFCAAGLGLVEETRAFFGPSGQLAPGAARTGSSRLAADGSRLPCPPATAVEQISDALYIACRNAHTDVVRFLLTMRPDLSFRAFMGGTALHWAWFGGSAEVIQLLQRAGADPAARDHVLRCTPRAFAVCAPASWGLLFLVRRRIAQDPALINVTDGSTSPLHEAARGGHLEMVRWLLSAGADPTLRDGAGETPLDVAQNQDHAAVVESLRAAGGPASANGG